MSKTIIITGGRGGFGAAMATRFRQLGHTVVTPSRESFWRDLAQLERVDVLFCNGATPGPEGPFIEQNLAEWWECLHTNLILPVEQVQSTLDLMIPNRCGKLILMSGGGATQARPGHSAYACSKAALVRFGETLAQELLGTGITVNMLAPGRMPTKMTQFQGDPAQIPKAVELAVWLASEESDHVTGKLIHANADWRTDYARQSVG